jgi:hypothetical protein
MAETVTPIDRNPIDLSKFPLRLRPYATTQPFSYTDATTYLEVLEGLRLWLFAYLTPKLNEEFDKLSDAWELEVGAIKASMEELLETVDKALEDQRLAVNTALEVQDQKVDGKLTAQDAANKVKIDAMIKYVDDAVQSIINSTITVTDPVIVGVVGNTASNSRKMLDKLYKGNLYLEEFYLDADNNDYALALLRAMNVATITGQAIMLRRIYPYATRIPASAAPGNVAIHGQGRGTGFKGPVDAPVTLLNWTGKANIELRNFSYDGGVTPALLTTISNRGIRFINCDNIVVEGLYVANHANWGTSFEQCRNITVKNHVHDKGGNGKPGGRDGVHFLDCTDFLLDTAWIWSGDDCVGVTSAEIGTLRGVIRNVSGKSDAANIVISNEEAGFTKPTYDLTIDGVTALEPARNIVRVQGINTGTITERITVRNVRGETRNGHAMHFHRIKDLSVSDSTVKGSSHGVYIQNCEDFSFTNVEASTLVAATLYDGFNLTASSKGAMINCRSRNAGQFGMQINDCTDISVVEPIIIEGGSPRTEIGGGGGLRIVNTTDVSVVGGSIVGDLSNTGLSHSSNTRLRVTDYTRIRAKLKMSGRLTGPNSVQMPVALARFADTGSEADGALITNGSRYRCTITRVSLGVYTIIVLDADGNPVGLAGTNFVLQATAGLQAAGNRSPKVVRFGCRWVHDQCRRCGG